MRNHIETKIGGVLNQLDQLWQMTRAPVGMTPLLGQVIQRLALAIHELEAVLVELQEQNQLLLSTRQELETEQLRYQTLFNLAPDAYLATNVHGTIRQANHAAAKLFNTSQQSLVGLPLTVFVPRTGHRSYFARLVRLRKPFRNVASWDLNICPRGSRPRPVTVRVGVDYDSAGKIQGLLWLFRDVPKQKLDSLHRKSHRQAMALEKTNGIEMDFLAYTAHELRTPINAIIGYTGLIKDRIVGEVTPRQNEVLENILTRSNDLIGMMNGLTDLSRLELKAMKVELGEVDLNRCMNDLKSTYEIPRKQAIELHWEYPSKLPILRTDGEKLKHILQNLIVNAIKFTKKGSVTVTVKPLANGRQFKFEVSDTGIGIAKKDLPHIFEKFMQANDGEAKASGSVGLGLYIAKKFTDLLGGTLKVKTAPGKGSTFTLILAADPA